ncbi:hypothetical protein [Serratia proteamaculans]
MYQSREKFTRQPRQNAEDNSEEFVADREGLKQNDRIYNRLKDIASSAKKVSRNLNMGDGEVAARMGINILTTLASGTINYSMGMVVPAIGAAPAALAGIMGTATGDVVNTALSKLVGTDLTPMLNMDNRLPQLTNPLRDFLKNDIKPRVKDYAFAMATENSFPYAVSEPLDASRPQNSISGNINNASNLIYGRGQLAQMAFQDTKCLQQEVDTLEKLGFSNISSLPADAHIIAGATMTKSPKRIVGKVGLKSKKRMVAEFVSMVIETRNALAVLQDDALRIGYPAGWLLRHGESKPVEPKYDPIARRKQNEAARMSFYAMHSYIHNSSNRKPPKSS